MRPAGWFATGSPVFVKRPSLFDSPGIVLYREYLRHEPQSAEYRLHATRADDRRLVLDFAVVIQSDSA